MTTATVFSRRSVESAISKWMEERRPTTLVVIPPGVRTDTTALSSWISWTMQTSRLPLPRNGVLTATGSIRVDLYWSRLDTVLHVQPIARGARIEDDVIKTLELASIPIFDMKAFEDASGSVKATTGAITSSSTSVTLNSVSGMAASGEVTIGAERITYAAISTNTLTGLTRGVGESRAFAHVSGSEVAVELGAEIALVYCEEAEVSPLGYDVAAQRMRTLIRVPFTVAYAVP